MALSETTLQKLKKKQEELEQTASKPARAEEPEEAPPRHRSLAQCIYADNRKRVSRMNVLRYSFFQFWLIFACYVSEFNAAVCVNRVGK